MIFQDNVIKEYLKNVYFITGTPCGGKTTVSRALAEKYGFELFDVDERFDEHKKMSNPLFQPVMNTYFNSADEFFGRTVEECKSITGSIGELCNRNVQSSRDIIEITEELRSKVYELESCLGSFSQSEYYQYWDDYYHDEQLMD